MDAKTEKKAMKEAFASCRSTAAKLGGGGGGGGGGGLRNVVIVGASVLLSVGDQKEPFHMTYTFFRSNRMVYKYSR